jgi:hypothetical protein
VPLLVLLVVQRFRGELSRARFVVALAIGLLVQLGLSTEILATGCFLGALTCLVFCCAGAEDRRRYWPLAQEIFFATLVMTVLAAPFLYFCSEGYLIRTGQINSPDSYSADLLNYLVPHPLARIGGNFFSEISRGFTGIAAEQRPTWVSH